MQQAELDYLVHSEAASTRDGRELRRPADVADRTAQARMRAAQRPLA